MVDILSSSTAELSSRIMQLGFCLITPVSHYTEVFCLLISYHGERNWYAISVVYQYFEYIICNMYMVFFSFVLVK